MYLSVYELSMGMHYYVLHMTTLVAMATMYMVNFVTKLEKPEEKGHSLSHFYNSDQRKSNL